MRRALVVLVAAAGTAGFLGAALVAPAGATTVSDGTGGTGGAYVFAPGVDPGGLPFLVGQQPTIVGTGKTPQGWTNSWLTFPAF